MSQQAVTITTADETTKRPVNITLTVVAEAATPAVSAALPKGFAAPRGFLPDKQSGHTVGTGGDVSNPEAA